MAPKYKLTYFNLPGSAEPVRYIFAYAGQEFEDNRIKWEAWPALRPKTPFGKLPVLEIDGKEFTQSTAIARYLAKQFGLVGKDELEALQVDVLVDTFGDLKPQIIRGFHEKDEEKLAEIRKEEAFYLEKFEKIVSGNPPGFLVGSQITWADLVIASALHEMRNRNPDSLKPYPALAKLLETVNSLPNIKAYLEKRPKSDPIPQGPPSKK